MRMTIFNELRWREIQQQGPAAGRDLLMLSEEIAELREEIEQLFIAAEDAKEESERLQREHDGLRDEWNDLFGENEDLHAKNNELSNRLSDMTAEQGNQLNEQNELEETISTLRLQLAEAIQERDCAVGDGARLVSRLEELRGSWNQTIRENDNLTRAWDQAVKERDALLANLTTEIVMLSNQHTDLHDIVSTLRMQLADATQEIGRLRRTVDAIELMEMLS